MSMDLHVQILNMEQGFWQAAPPQTNMRMEISSVLMTGGPMGSGPNPILILEYASVTFQNALPVLFLYTLAPRL